MFARLSATVGLLAALVSLVAQPASAQMSLPGKFAVNATGAATYSIPIAVPPGTAGMTPSLTLEYNSQGGNGILGLGWSLGGLPSIGRCAPTIAQDGARGAVTYTYNDRFCMEGQRLILVSGTYGGDGAEYRTEIDSFSRIFSYSRYGNGPGWFAVYTKSGQIMYFGLDQDSRIVAQGQQTIRSWAVSKVMDRKGNYFTVNYFNDAANGEARPTSIYYTGNDAAGVPAYNAIEFTYAGGRPDPLLAFEAGSQQQTSVLLTDVRTYTPSALVADYRLSYAQTPSTGRSILTSITLCAGDGSCLPATTFNWNTASDGFQPGNPVPWQTSGAGNNVSFTTGDIDGDGKSDLIAYFLQNGQLQVYAALSNGSGSFNGPYLTTLSGFWGSSQSFLNVLMGDVDGDGRADVILVMFNMTGFRIYVALSNGAGGFGNLIPWDSGALDGWGNGAYLDPNNGSPVILWNAAAVDINGDGRADVVAYMGGQTYTALSTGTGFSAARGWTTPNFYPGTWLVDINGDGRADLLSAVTTSDGFYVAAALSNGDGTYGPAQYSHVPGNYSPGWGATIGDVNGDGRTDVVAYFLGSGGVEAQVALSLGDGHFTFQPMWQRAAGDLRGYSLSIADINGDGRGDLIAYKFTQNALSMGAALAQSNGQFEDPIYFPTAQANTTGWQLATADIDGDGRTDLIAYAFTPGSTFTAVTARAPSPAIAIASIVDGLGVATNITYFPITSTNGVYYREAGTAYPMQDVQGPLYVVEQTSTSDGVGGFYTIEYRYFGARLDLTGRGFLGFYRMDIWDPQIGIGQTNLYRQDFPYIGLVSSEIRQTGTSTLNEKDNMYDAVQLGGSPWRVRLRVTTEQSVDLDGTALPMVTTSYQQYDDYNNPTQVTVSTPDGYSKTTVNAYYNDTYNWVLGRLYNASVTSTMPSGAYATRSSSFAYDGYGLLLQEFIEPGTPTLRTETDTAYDAFGNKIQVTVSGIDVASRSTSSTYDARGQFAVHQSNALGQGEDWQFDPRFGKPTYHRGPNGLVTQWQYDSFGRKTLELRADQNRTVWTYTLCASGCLAGEAYYVLTIPQDSGGNLNGAMSLVFFDTLDRETRHYTQGFDGQWINVYTIYNQRGLVVAKSRPYLPTDSIEWTLYAYDALGRVVTEQFPDSSTRQHAYRGLVTDDTDALMRLRRVEKNSQGQVQAVREWDQSGNPLSRVNFAYDPFGNVLTTTDIAGNVVSNQYDTRGRKTAASDPDLGNWTYAYDTLGQLVTQTDAKGQTTTFSYDVLGRLIERDEPDMTSTWVYDTAAYGIGKLASASATGAAAGANGHHRTWAYDNLGRPADVGVSVDGITLHTYAVYDSNGRLVSIVYPSGFYAGYSYNGYGYLQQLFDARSGRVFWTANARDAELHLTSDTLGDGVTTTRTFDPQTGRLTGIYAGSSNYVAAYSYTYDRLGNLTNRTNFNAGISENLAYDAANRITNSQVQIISTGQISAANVFGYDTLGNLISKTGLGTYAYPPPGQPHPHAVSSISGGAINTVFTYDNNGNQTGGLGRSVTYTSYNKPASIMQGSASLSFVDDADHQRYRQATPEAIIYYFDAFGSHEETVGSGGQWSWNSYLTVGGTMIGMRVQHPDGSASLRYFHQDHLGSVAIITDESGQIVERNSYDAWGKRRFLNGIDDPSGSLNTSSQTTRGFTGEEFLADAGLVHLNGRVYDPFVGRMMSADPVVGDPLNAQTWNRYSYVYNRPLTLTDPTGLCPWSACIGYAGPARVSGGALRLITDVLRTAIVAACVGLIPGCAPLAPVFAAVTSSFSTVINGGDLNHALVSGAVSGATALAFKAVGDITLGPGHPQPNFDSPNFIPNVVGHGLVGCGSAVASGGKCGAGALSAGVAAFAGPVINHLDFAPGLVVSATLGGLASVAGGDKFANGAITGAFGYLFNQAENVARGRAAENLWEQSVVNEGGEVVGRNLKYYAVDAEGNPILRDGKRVRGELDGLSRARDGVIDAAEVKNGNSAKWEGSQLERSQYVREGRIRFYGTAAAEAGLEGHLLSEFAGERPIAFRYYVGPAGAQRATREYLRFLFRRGAGAGE